MQVRRPTYCVHEARRTVRTWDLVTYVTCIAFYRLSHAVLASTDYAQLHELKITDKDVIDH